MTMDAVLLMLLHNLGGAWRTSAETVLKKKMASGVITFDLFKAVMIAHQVPQHASYNTVIAVDTVDHPVFTDGFQISPETDKMQYPFGCLRTAAVLLPSIHGLCILQEELKDFFPTLLDFAGALTSAAPEPARKAGAAMYVALFLQFEGSYHRQVTTRRADPRKNVHTCILPSQHANLCCHQA